MNELEGKTALVTGASRGIGRAFAKALAKKGAFVVINYVGNEEKAHEVQVEIEQEGGKCALAKVDLTRADCAEAMAEEVPSVDILVLNASIQFRKKWSDITLEEFDTQVNCNLRSSMLLIQKYVPAMAQRGWGRVITVGSVQEAKPHSDMLVYSATKSALTSMAKSLALQLAPTGVTVNSIAPGVILTDRNSKALSDREYYQSTIARIPVGFCGRPEECVGTLLMLCSDEARYITGQNIFVDGGMGIK